MIYYYVYKTTNLINNKIYVGVHQTKKLDDGYMGSGIALNNAIKKYGIENFKKEILEFFDNENDMFLKEAEIVDIKFIEREDTYNMMTGGIGGVLGVKQSIEMIKKRAKTLRENGWYDTENTSRYNTIWITNGLVEKVINKNDSIPEGFIIGRSPQFCKKQSERHILSDTITELNKYRRQLQQIYWDENPEEFEKVKQKREKTRKVNGDKKFEETGYRINYKISKEERSLNAKKAANVVHEKMKNDPEYRKKVIQKRKDTSKRNLMIKEKGNLKYKNFEGNIEFSKKDNCFHGKVLNFEDIISYEGNTIEELEKDFQNAIDFYLELKK